MTPERGGFLERSCPECNAQPGEPCADTPEERIRHAVATGELTAITAVDAAELHSDTSRELHDWLDSLGVPRHGMIRRTR